METGPGPGGTIAPAGEQHQAPSFPTVTGAGCGRCIGCIAPNHCSSIPSSTTSRALCLPQFPKDLMGSPPRAPSLGAWGNANRTVRAVTAHGAGQVIPDFQARRWEQMNGALRPGWETAPGCLQKPRVCVRNVRAAHNCFFGSSGQSPCSCLGIRLEEAGRSQYDLKIPSLGPVIDAINKPGAGEGSMLNAAPVAAEGGSEPRRGPRHKPPLTGPFAPRLLPELEAKENKGCVDSVLGQCKGLFQA